MFTELAEKWRAEFNETTPSQPLDLTAWSAVIAFCWWLQHRPTPLAVDEGQAISNNVRETIKEARHWMLESETDPRPEIKREIVITYLNMIERSLETPIATKA